jgi:predicted glycosyltransferase involved in capsule biosynthesis
MISIAMTFKGREDFLDFKLKQLLYMNFNPKDIEVCITVPEYTQRLMEVVNYYYKSFHQIKLAISDRDKLPFKITTNQPTCDMNAQICNQVSFEKVIRTDPEVLFCDPNQLQYISNILDDPEICLWHDTINPPPDAPISLFDNMFSFAGKHNCESNTCCCFSKSEFIKQGGFDERFALGVAAEDSYFINGFTKRGKSIKSEYDVIHQFHGTPWNARADLMEIYYAYTLPLFLGMEERQEKSNINNTEWQRPEMLSNELVYKE